MNLANENSPSVQSEKNQASTSREGLSSDAQLASTPSGIVARILAEIDTLKIDPKNAPIFEALQTRGLISSKSAESFQLKAEERKAIKHALNAIESAEGRIESNQQIVALIESQNWTERIFNFISGQRRIDQREVAIANSATEREIAICKENQDVLVLLRNKETALEKHRQAYVQNPLDGSYWQITPRGQQLQQFIEAHGEALTSLPYRKFEQGCMQLEKSVQGKMIEIQTGIEGLLQVGFPAEIATTSAFAWAMTHGDASALVPRALEFSRLLTESELPADYFMAAFNALLTRSEEPKQVVENFLNSFNGAQAVQFEGSPFPLALYLSRFPDKNAEQVLLEATATAEKLEARLGLDSWMTRGIIPQLFGVSEKQADSISRIFSGLLNNGLLPNRELFAVAATLANIGNKKAGAAFLKCYQEAARIFGESSDLYIPCAILGASGLLGKSHLLIFQDVAGRLLESGYGKDSLIKGARLTAIVLGSLAKEDVPVYEALQVADPHDIVPGTEFGATPRSEISESSFAQSSYDSSSSDTSYLMLLGTLGMALFDGTDVHGGGFDSSAFDGGDVGIGADFIGIDTASGGSSFDFGSIDSISNDFGGGFDSFSGFDSGSGGSSFSGSDFGGGGFSGGGFDGGGGFSGGFDGGSGGSSTGW